MLIKRNWFLIVLIIVILAMIFITSSCKENEEETAQIPSEGTYIRYVEVEESIPYNIIEAEVVYFNEYELFEMSDLIFKGTVTDEKEIAFKEYRSGELYDIYLRDFFTFKINKIYYSKDSSLKNGDTIRVSNSSCSNRWIKGTIKMEKGKEYVVLTKKTEDGGKIKFSKYYDYYVIHPWQAIISIENGGYIFDEVFTSLISGSKEEKIREDNGFETKIYKKDKEFEEELEDLILEKKGES